MKTFIISFYELKRIFRNWRLLLIILSQPIIISLIVGFMAYKSPDNIKVVLYNQQKNHASQEFEKEIKKSNKLNIQIVEQVHFEDIKENKIRAIIKTNFTEGNSKYSGEINLYKDSSGNFTNMTVEQEVQIALKKVNEDKLNQKNGEIKLILSKYNNLKDIDLAVNPVNINSEEYPIKNLSFFNYFGSSIIVLLIFLVVLNLSAITITSDKESGTFERISVTPYTKTNIIFGKSLAQFTVGLTVSLLGFLTLFLVFKIHIGNIYLLGLLNIIISAVAVAIGVFISSITRTVVESVESAMYVFFIAVLTSGIILPIETAHRTFVYVNKLLPFSYAIDTSRRINMLNANWLNIQQNIFILLGFLILFMFLAIVSLRKEVK